MEIQKKLRKKNKKRKLTVCKSSHQGDDIFLVFAVSHERKKISYFSLLCMREETERNQFPKSSEFCLASWVP